MLRDTFNERCMRLKLQNIADRNIRRSELMKICTMYMD